MKNTLTASLALIMFAATPAMAQTASSSKPEKPVAKPAKPVKVKPAKKESAEATFNRASLKSEATNVAAGIEAADAALTPAELAIAERVDVGMLPCELGASVTMTADAKNPGYFTMQGKNFSYRLFPVPTSTGAIRLEDKKAGAVWLQLANKSMLMNQKLGIRLADECMSPAQMRVADNLKRNPAVSILEPLPVTTVR